MPIPAFTAGYPPDGSSLGQTKSIIRNNIDGTFETLGVDHINNNGQPGPPGTPAGYHQQSRYINKASAPTTAAGQLALYSKQGAISSELFMIRDGNAGTEVNLTTSKIGNATAAANGVSWLPGGILIQWGSISAAFIANNAPVSFTTPFPNNLFSITIGPTSSSTDDKTISIKTGSETTSGFLVRTSGSSAFQKLYWMAIGN